jgi:CHRD domain
MTGVFMRRGVGVCVVIGVALLALSVVAGATGRRMSTTLSGAEEVPAGVGDPNGTGTAELNLNAGQEEVCFELTWQNLDGTVQRAHIHEAAAGVNGGIVVSFLEGASLPGTGSASGCDLGDATRAEIRRILRNPSGFYVNVHDTVRPGGAIRGQLGD